jgi:hypothetical protein
LWVTGNGGWLFSRGIICSRVRLHALVAVIVGDDNSGVLLDEFFGFFHRREDVQRRWVNGELVASIFHVISSAQTKIHSCPESHH